MNWERAFERFLWLVGVCGAIGSLSFIVGQSLSRERFDFRAFPYAPFKFERGGNIYRRCGVHLWKDRVPDMSRIIRGVFKKKLPLRRDRAYLLALIRETCVAEFVHMILILASPVFLFVLDESAGWIAMAAYALVNLPFIIIQRYIRPKLVTLYERETARPPRGK
jgi:glycosyl-4,4'-diaponeurosporenoate acyltransferase